MTFHSPLPPVTTPAPARPGRITLVGAGPGAADLLTLRAVRCLGQADVVFYDRLVDPEVLDLARPGARRVFCGKELGAHSWPQERINAEIVAAARQGLRVVRLKSGDPSIFGRAAEEIAAARAHDLAVDVIPGITAASAAAARMCQPLTERGLTERLVLATATCRPGDPPADFGGLVQPGSSLVFYMAMQQLALLSAQLQAAGLGADHPVTVAANVEKPGAATLHTSLARLEADCAAAGLRNPAVVMVAVARAGDGVAAIGAAGQRQDAAV
jgi:uroporphyrin-III C-methyltransferase